MDKFNKLLRLQHSRYQIDSRLIKENDIFFALKGNRTDGHLHLGEVAKKRAKIAIILKEYNLPKILNSRDLDFIRVKSVLAFLQGLAKESLKNSRAGKIAITGSMGKTTTKEFISILLGGEYGVSKTFRNYNSQAGFPIAILNMDKDVDFLVLEMAMDEKNEIEKLVRIAPPDIAIITQLIRYHQNFDGIEDLACVKKEVFCHKNTKIKLINKKLLSLKAFQDEKYLTFSIEDKKADFYLDVKNEFFYEMGKKIKFVLPFLEKHLLEDLTASVAVCRLVNESYENIFKGFQFLKSEKMRFEKVFINDILFIKDCYNANPCSTIAALVNLPKVKGKKIAVLGSNLELGKFSKEAHEEIIKIAKKNVDEILCLGEEWDHIKDIKIFSDHEDLARYLIKIAKKNDVVLIKGSRFMQMEKIFNFIN